MINNTSNSLEQILTNASTGCSAQSIRMNTIASNLANTGSVGSSEQTTYHTKYPVFTEITQQMAGINQDDVATGGVQVTDIMQSKKPLERRYDPNNPSAGEDGYVYISDVNTIEQMTNMIAASHEYQANVEVMNTTKNLIIQSLGILNTK